MTTPVTSAWSSQGTAGAVARGSELSARQVLGQGIVIPTQLGCQSRTSEPLHPTSTRFGDALVSTGELAAALVAQSAVGAVDLRALSISASHPRDLSAPAAPVAGARVRARLDRSGVRVRTQRAIVPARRGGGACDRSKIESRCHFATIGSCARKPKPGFRGGPGSQSTLWRRPLRRF